MYRAASGAGREGQRQRPAEGAAEAGLQRCIVEQLCGGVAAAIQQVVLQDGLRLGGQGPLRRCCGQACAAAELAWCPWVITAHVMPERHWLDSAAVQ